MRKTYKFFCFGFLLFLISCYGPRIPNEVLRVIEEEDNNLCIMQGVEFESEDTRMIYWKCRLRVMDQRISGEFDDYGYSLLYKRDFKKLRKKIKDRIEREREIGLAQIDSSLEEKEHSYCVMLRDENEQMDVEIYDYFKCRENLAKLRKESSNSANLTNDYMIKVFEYQDEEIPDQSNTLFVDSECIKYSSNQEKFKKCRDAIRELNKCYANIDNQIMQRRLDDKVYCTKTSINKYPDSLSIFNADDTTNSTTLGPRMNKMDLVGLREKELKKCYRERTIKMLQYREYLENQCKLNNLKAIEP